MLWTLMTCWGKLNAIWFYFHTVLLMSFHGWNTNRAITWGMRLSVMFTHVKTTSTVEGMNVHSCCTLPSAGLYGSHRGTGADRGRSSQCWVNVGFIPAVPEEGRLYSDLLCHIKDCQNGIYYLNFLEKKSSQNNLTTTAVVCSSKKKV